MNKICNQCQLELTPTNLKKHYLRKHPDLWEQDKHLYSKCYYCGIVLFNGLSGHIPMCQLNPNRDKNLLTRGGIKGIKYSEEAKLNMSNARKKWLKDNPDKHPWKSKTKFKSEPCEHLKKLLLNENISFAQEYQPSTKRFFSIDIAFPSKQLGIEVNGRQHYNSQLELLPYYKERQEFLESIGWKILNIYYSSVFDKNIINTVKLFLENNGFSTLDFEFDQKSFLLEKDEIKKKRITCVCGKSKFKYAILCKSCDMLRRTEATKSNYSEEYIENAILLVKTLGYVKAAKQLNVSDTGLKKRLKSLGVDVKNLSLFSKNK